MTDIEFLFELTRRELEPMGYEVLTARMRPHPSRARHVFAMVENRLNDETGEWNVVLVMSRVIDSDVMEIYSAAAFETLKVSSSLLAKAIVALVVALDKGERRHRRNAKARERRAKAKKKGRAK